MKTKLAVALVLTTLLSGCMGGGVIGMVATAANNGCSISEQAAAERRALDAGKPVTTATCKE